MKEKIMQGLKEYQQLNLSWNIESMLYINSKNVLLRDLLDDDNFIEPLILIMVAGDENRDAMRIKTFINKFIMKYKNIDFLRWFVLFDLKNSHKFLKDIEDDDTEPINELLASKEEEPADVDREKELKENREFYKYALFTYMRAGYKVDEALKMNMTNFNYVNEYVLRNREETLNSLMLLAHRCGMLSGVAFANMKKYPDKPENIRLRPMSKEERIEKIKADAEKFRRESVAELDKQ